ncbi:trichohyalin [Nasonia vitripennis]|uniref:Coiled-coil domain-containing protein n=1 Tax=Nasonia vitripennis TaxID=7425 RepID=A0A7M7H6H6_NASVI|nr:trichohyalin [Nasonia vitripennis]
MNGDRSEQRSAGLSRSYSEHAALVLRHFERQRGELKCSRSGPDFRIDCRQDEEETLTESRDGQRTWRISGSPSEDDYAAGKQQHCHRKRLELGSGDSNAISSDFSELSLERRQTTESTVYEGSRVLAASSTPETTTSSMERRCRLFDDDERYSCATDNEEDREAGGGEPQESQFRHRKSPPAMHEMEASNSWSTTSLSSGRHRLNGVPLLRQISYEDWAREKRLKLQNRREEERRAEERKREAEEREAREREARERRDNESYLGWLERKRREQTLKRQLLDKELELQHRLRELENKAKSAKDVFLKQWCRKKDELIKTCEKEELMRKKKAEEEKERRLQESSKAYEKWREKSRNTPKPATQGLLPHQKVKPAFTNPTPWQPLLEKDSDDSDNSSPAVTTSRVVKTNRRSKRTAVRR